MPRREPRTGPVIVGVIDLAAWDGALGCSDVSDVSDAVDQVLSRAELQRLGRLRDPLARRRFACAHVALRWMLGSQLGVPPATLEFVTGRHGKPGLARPETDLEFNLSHSGGIALVAVCRGRRVGVDIEQVTRARREVIGSALRLLPPPEAASVSRLSGPEARVAFTHLWTRKEACVKAAGGTMLSGLSLPVGFPGRRGVVVRDGTAGSWQDPDRVTEWQVRDLALMPDYCAAVALTGPARFDVTIRPLEAPEGWPG